MEDRVRRKLIDGMEDKKAMEDKGRSMFWDGTEDKKNNGRQREENVLGWNGG